MPRSVVSKSRHDDTFYTRTGGWVRVSFCDPAFGGKDKAVWGMASFGMAIAPDGNGSAHTVPIFEIEDYFKRLSITKDATYNEFWISRLRAIGVKTGDIVIGSEVSPDDQIAIQCAELNMKHHIPADNFGYDFSMRAHIVTSMTEIVGRCHAFEYNRPPEGVWMEKYKENSDVICKDRVTELAFLTAELYERHMIRGGEKCETANIQLSRTKFKTINKKKKCENKREYKLRWQGQSPDHRDVLLGLRGMADKKGMAKSSLKPMTSSDSDLAERLKKKFKIRKVKRVY